MTLDLAAIEKRANAVLPGPWSWAWVNLPGQTVEEPEAEITQRDGGRIALAFPDDRQDTATLAFIAAARTDVPALCARVRELEHALAEEREETRGTDARATQAERRVRELEALSAWQWKRIGAAIKAARRLMEQDAYAMFIGLVDEDPDGGMKSDPRAVGGVVPPQEKKS